MNVEITKEAFLLQQIVSLKSCSASKYFFLNIHLKKGCPQVDDRKSISKIKWISIQTLNQIFKALG